MLSRATESAIVASEKPSGGGGDGDELRVNSDASVSAITDDSRFENKNFERGCIDSRNFHEDRSY